MSSDPSRQRITDITLATVKDEARKLRAQRAAIGAPISHSQALEAVAHHHGARDWNALRARLATHPSPTSPPGWKVGQRLRGRYLGQDFVGTVVTAGEEAAGWTRLSIQLDAPVDVVTFASFSAFRRRISATVGPGGRTRERTSNGSPHLEVVPLR